MGLVVASHGMLALSEAYPVRLYPQLADHSTNMHRKCFV